MGKPSSTVKKKNEAARYYISKRDGWIPDGLRIWWVHRVRERCACRIGDGRAEYKNEVLLGR